MGTMKRQRPSGRFPAARGMRVRRCAQCERTRIVRDQLVSELTIGEWTFNPQSRIDNCSAGKVCPSTGPPRLVDYYTLASTKEPEAVARPSWCSVLPAAGW